MKKIKRHKRYKYSKSENRRKKGIKVRLRPTAEQKNYISQCVGCRRFVFNYCVGYVQRLMDEKREYVSRLYENYLCYGESFPQGFTFSKKDEYIDVKIDATLFNNVINDIKKPNDDGTPSEYDFINRIPQKVVQQAINDCVKAFKGWLNGTSGFPKFKKKNDDENTARFPDQAIMKSNGVIDCIDGTCISINKHLQRIPFKCSSRDTRYLNRNQNLIHNITFSKTKTCKYNASILIEDVEQHKLKKSHKKTGHDLGIKTFCTSSDGQKHEAPKRLDKVERKRKRLQRELARRVKGSKNREKTRMRLARTYEKETNVRKDFQHKLSTELVKENGVLVFESLNIKSMLKNHHLAASIQERSWGTFLNMVEYKSEKYNRQFVKIDQWYPSSKTCSKCGTKKESLKLSERVWKCPHCGAILDRDINAAVGICKEGLRMLSDGSTV